MAYELLQRLYRSIKMEHINGKKHLSVVGGINFGNEDLTYYDEGTYIPVVTLVGGTGNTVPVYATNTGRYTRIGNRCFVEIYLDGDGGNEGAGTGRINISLPITPSASSLSHADSLDGRGVNNTTFYQLAVSVGAGVSTCWLRYWTSVSAVANFTGDLQNNGTRSIILNFSYEV